MTFAGLPREKQRADVIAYLNSNSDSPQPLPKAAAAAPAGRRQRAGRSPPQIGGCITGSSSRAALPHADVKAISSRIAPGTLAPQFEKHIITGVDCRSLRPTLIGAPN